MRLRSGRIVKDHRTTEGEESGEENLIQESDGEESPNKEAESEYNDPEEETNISEASTTTSAMNQQEANPHHPIMNDDQFQTAVQVAIAAMRATQPATAPVTEGTSRSIPGLKDAPKFNGKTDVRMWIRRFEAYANAMKWSTEDQLQTLTVALEESANEWLWSQERRDPENEDKEEKLARRKAGLIRRFGETMISHADYTQIYALKQGPKETIDELMERMDAIERRLPEPAPENIKKFAFISALRPQLRLKVEEQQVATMDDAIDAARRQEVIYLKVYGPRKDATETTATIPIPRYNGPPRFGNRAPAAAETAPYLPPPLRIGGYRPTPDMPPRPFMGGGPPRFPLGGGPPRPSMGGGITVPRSPAAQNAPEIPEKELDELIQRFQQVKIGSTEHTEWQRWAMSTGRCYKCLRKGHIGRECPGRIPAQRRAEYEYPEEETNEDDYDCMEAIEDTDPHGA